MGGASVTLCKATFGGASWGVDGMIVFGEQGAIMRVSESGGTPEEIVKGGNEDFIFPQILPDGKSVLFTVVAGNRFQVAVQSLESGEQKDLFPGGPAQYLPTGHLVYGLENNLMAIRFDPNTLEAIGGPVPLVEGVFRGGRNRPTQSAISRSGTLIYLPDTTASIGRGPERSLVWVDRQGKEEPITAAPNNYQSPRISPDATKVALAIEDGEKNDIWIWDVVRENMTRLTFNESSGMPLWTLDGKRIAFISGWGDKVGVYWKAADGTGKDEILVSKPGRILFPSSWSSDGDALVTTGISGNNFDIGSLSMEGDHEWKPLLQEEYGELQPQISPDGQWMAYTSNESGKPEIYVRPFPDVDSGRWQVSTDGGVNPLWSPDGRELYYIRDNNEGRMVMAVSAETEPTFKAGKPETLFQAPSIVLGSMEALNIWDISPDGKRFIMMKSLLQTENESSEKARSKINIVVNWFEELKERVPVD
jgi:serine/threonine-protein kinase